MVFRGQAEVVVGTLDPGMGLGLEGQGAARVSDDLIVSTIRTRLRRLMIEELEENGFREDFSNDESLLENQVLDSLSILKLISFLDEVFGISLSEEELEPERFETVDRIVDLIRYKTAGRKE